MDRYRIVSLFLMLMLICSAAVLALVIDLPVLRAVLVFLSAVGAAICGCVLACESPSERAARMSIRLDAAALEEERALDAADAKREAREDPPAGEVEGEGLVDDETEARRRAAAVPWREILRRAGITEPERAVAEFLPAPARTPAFLPHSGYEDGCTCPACVADNAVKAERKIGWALDADIESQSDGIARAVGLSPSHRVALRILARHVLLNEAARSQIDVPTNVLMMFARESRETGLDPLTIAIAVGDVAKRNQQTFAQYVGNVLDEFGTGALEQVRGMLARMTPTTAPTSS